MHLKQASPLSFWLQVMGIWHLILGKSVLGCQTVPLHIFLTFSSNSVWKLESLWSSLADHIGYSNIFFLTFRAVVSERTLMKFLRLFLKELLLADWSATLRYNKEAAAVAFYNHSIAIKWSLLRFCVDH